MREKKNLSLLAAAYAMFLASSWLIGFLAEEVFFRIFARLGLPADPGT